eukprot:SAG31_NODE_582_length_13925_cov_32.209967_4_plen_477_part_00
MVLSGGHALHYYLCCIAGYQGPFTGHVLLDRWTKHYGDSWEYHTCSCGGSKTLRSDREFWTVHCSEVSDSTHVVFSRIMLSPCRDRHVVAPGLDTEKVKAMLEGPYDCIAEPSEALKVGRFAALYEDWSATFAPADGYSLCNTRSQERIDPVAFRLAIDDQFPYGIDEHWRRIYVDVTSPKDTAEMSSKDYLNKLSRWLITEQPIALAINGDNAAAGYPIAMQLFEQTAQVVYSIGTDDSPCYTCQARPQDGEVFGEFPPRRELSKYTKAPVVVPTSTPSYNAHYTSKYLERVAAEQSTVDISAVTKFVQSLAVRGYLHLVAEYLADACGPKLGCGKRTTLWGLQRPPLNGDMTIVRCGRSTGFDQAAIYLLPFYVTNAANQVVLSCDPANEDLMPALFSLNQRIQVRSETTTEFEARASTAWNVVNVDSAAHEFPLVGQFVSCLFALGHIKSVATNDKEFVQAFSKSAKWLQMNQ